MVVTQEPKTGHLGRDKNFTGRFPYLDFKQS